MCLCGEGESNMILCSFYQILTSTQRSSSFACVHSLVYFKVCNPHQISKQKDCLVYSVGSNGKAEFEKAVMEEIGNHCEIHSKYNSCFTNIVPSYFPIVATNLSHNHTNMLTAFDPVSYNKRNGNFKEALDPYSTFHNWGLGTEDQARKDSMYKTIKKTMAELGHTGKTIDIFVRTCCLYNALLKYCFNVLKICKKILWPAMLFILIHRKLTVNGVNGSRGRNG